MVVFSLKKKTVVATRMILSCFCFEIKLKSYGQYLFGLSSILLCTLHFVLMLF